MSSIVQTPICSSSGIGYCTCADDWASETSAGLRVVGRSDVELYFQWLIAQAKLSHQPLLAFVREGADVEVRLLATPRAVLRYPDDTRIMGQWPGKWSSHFFRFQGHQFRAFVEQAHTDWLAPSPTPAAVAARKDPFDVTEEDVQASLLAWTGGHGVALVRRRLQDVMYPVTRRMHEVFEAYYGHADGRARTREEVAAELGIKPTNARTYQRKCFAPAPIMLRPLRLPD